MRHEITIIEEFDNDFEEDAIVSCFSELPSSAILDSSLKSSELGEYTIIGFDAFMFFTSKGDRTVITAGAERSEKRGNPLEILRDLLKKYQTIDSNSRLLFTRKDASYSNAKATYKARVAIGSAEAMPFIADDTANSLEDLPPEEDLDSNCKLPFYGGCIGYFSYDLVNFIEKIKQKCSDDLNVNDIELGFYNKVIIINHIQNKLFMVGTSIGTNGDPKAAASENIQDIREILAKIITTQYTKAPQNKENPIRQENSCSPKSVNLRANFSRQNYVKIVEKAREYIHNGDIFQVNLSQRFEADISNEPSDIYLLLRKCSPAPFSAYLNFENIKVICSSPERFLKTDGRYIETRPIKGTRPRGKDIETDIAMRNELLESEKERAELTMIVDLERNDLGKLCEFGSVKVKRHFEIQAYANVFHAVSTVTGKLKEGKDVIDCLYAAFPGGSITGAPKIRAMEIIEENEPVKRGIYTGSIGYIGFDGNIDLNIAIRTIIVKGDKAFYNVGGGIVWDSIPEDEYEETLHKGTKMMAVLTGGDIDMSLQQTKQQDVEIVEVMNLRAVK